MYLCFSMISSTIAFNSFFELYIVILINTDYSKKFFIGFGKSAVIVSYMTT